MHISVSVVIYALLFFVGVCAFVLYMSYQAREDAKRSVVRRILDSFRRTRL